MRRKPIPTFILHVGFLIVLIGFIPGTRELVPRVVHAVGNAMLDDQTARRSVRFLPVDSRTRRGHADTRMIGRRPGKIDYEWRIIFNAHSRVFWPLATLAALMVATPMPRLRRAWALPTSLTLFFVFFMGEIWAFTQVLFGAKRPVPPGETSLWREFVPIAEAMFNSPVTNFSLVFLLWAAFALPTRGIDTDAFNVLLRRLIGSGRAASPRTPGAAAEPADSADEARDGDSRD